jgi:hypothetical protein
MLEGVPVHDTRIRPAMQCPHVGCDAWAIVASADTTTLGAAYLWSCSNGHHGPRITGTVR